jgi:hypothetical protein
MINVWLAPRPDIKLTVRRFWFALPIAAVAPRRYLLDSSPANYQISAIGLYALLYRAAVESFAGLVPSRQPDRRGLSRR